MSFDDNLVMEILSQTPWSHILTLWLMRCGTLKNYLVSILSSISQGNSDASPLGWSGGLKEVSPVKALLALWLVLRYPAQ